MSTYESTTYGYPIIVKIENITKNKFVANSILMWKKKLKSSSPLNKAGPSIVTKGRKQRLTPLRMEISKRK